MSDWTMAGMIPRCRTGNAAGYRLGATGMKKTMK